MSLELDEINPPKVDGPNDKLRTIGLCMIVKNEAKVIARCLDSVKPLVDYVLIEDTGSTDGTQQIIRDWLFRENIPGEVIDEPWQNFAYNRSHAMEKLREVEGVDYALIIDADDKLQYEEGFVVAAFKAPLRDDLYDIQIRHDSARFYRPQLCSNRMAFHFKAVLHEYLDGPPNISRKSAEGFYVETGRGGARSTNPRKYQDDAAVLENALVTETDPFLISRYTFYLAQSYRDCGEHELALRYYLKRAELGYWDEEVFESLYSSAKLKEALNCPDDDVIAAFVKATNAVPTRAEALHGAARYCRLKGRNQEGYEFAARGLAISVPTSGLFVEAWIYEYGLLDEVAVNGYWSGHYRESLDACVRLLSGTALPTGDRERVAANARFSLEKLPKEPNLGAAGTQDLISHHAIVPERPLRSRISGAPRVLLAILAKQKEEMLPLYLECIEALDYPKSQIVLYVRTNNNTDGTERILREWAERVRPLYASVEYVASDVTEPVQQFAPHEWNPLRFDVLGRIRNVSLRRTLEQDCDFYFVVDVDNFVRPGTLRELVALNLPIVSPFLRSLESGRYYSNYHADVEMDVGQEGYYKDVDQYYWILNQWIRGVIEVPVVHTTYLVRADAIDELDYLDGSRRHEYVIFSETARKAAIPQYLDNRQVYGYIAFSKDNEHHIEGGIERARALLKIAFEGDAQTMNAHCRPKAILVCGPWGSGTSAVAGMLERMGAFGVGPYFGTADANTPSSYESIAFREVIRYALGYPSPQSFAYPADSPDAVQRGLGALVERIQKSEFGHYDSSRPIFLKYPLSAFVVPKINDVFDTKLIFVERPLEDIERTRVRRGWEPYYGAEGAAAVYGQMAAAKRLNANPIMVIKYGDLLASPKSCATDIARFAGLNPSADELRRAVAFVSKSPAKSTRVNRPRKSKRK